MPEGILIVPYQYLLSLSSPTPFSKATTITWFGQVTIRSV